ncbi:CubicO group peptidase (beta-lactamase class C family) [Pontibacter ummariensis]|uniref:CubicO group peptidase, beta-lactamase class C family n=1 Tax=Pontibacter ummariensis TaxID=1610492 RepID=A0A239EGQ5_9BACT|nr:serine hydrolase domain-containing protein [Pontibacter ummariensis]PRY13235.1 CubicO group peptidase (beta-lactamase class C family) [Pontibacter ummariensis]SNS43458.1 CubicO group peptidase, beta-lactamase class C family [Pontibacter ummariensis]
MYHITQATLDTIVTKTASHKNIHGAVFHVSSLDNSLGLTSAQGNIGIEDQYYIASINKLMVSALILRLCHENTISLSDKISEYFPLEVMKGLLKLGDKDYSDEITIQHLISHTSGLPCYLIDKQPGGGKNMDLILNGENQSWPFDKVIAVTKEMKPKFPPGKKGKANYAETNFRLLERIHELVTGKPIRQSLTELFKELGMRNTVVLPSAKADNCLPVYFKQTQITIDAYWKSTNKDIASTAQDLMLFLKAFFQGHFFQEKNLVGLEKWNTIFFPFKYGIGVQLFYIPRILSPFKAVPKIIGHCGSAGTIAFFVPEKKAFITGTVNQTANNQVAFQTLMKIINKL